MTAITTVSFQVKWGKETIDIKDFTLAAGTKGLKNEINEKTGIPVDRMKIMPKSKGLWKGLLKDDIADLTGLCDWTDVVTKERGGSVQILVMGSAVPAGSTGVVALDQPKQKTIFIEDLPPEEIAKVVEPSGLQNLGNTCYLNSVVQCLRVIPQLRQAIASYVPSNLGISNPTGPSVTPNPNNILFLLSLQETFNQLDRSIDAIQPMSFVQATKRAIPEFARTGPRGQPMQQDAEEFYSAVMTITATETQGSNKSYYINSAFAAPANSTTTTDPQAAIPSEEALMGATNVIDALFGLKMKETLTCDETMELVTDDAGIADVDANAMTEPPVVTYDLQRKLVCNIQGGVDISAPSGTGALSSGIPSSSSAPLNVNYINEGIQLSLEGKIEKHSSVLGRNAIWTRTQRIARLSPILVVQFQRFYWKATPDSEDHPNGVKCKVMKPVAFNSELDVYQFCCPEIQNVLKIARDKALAEEEDAINKKLKGATEAASTDDAPMDDATKPAATTTTDMDVTEEEDEDELKAALAMSMQPEQQPIGPGLSENFRGIYELFAVVTHKGRDADGGHYMAWVKADTPQSSSSGRSKKVANTDDMNDDWYVFDDDEVSPCKTEDVLKLKGGGDWHMSYLNFYRAKK